MEHEAREQREVGVGERRGADATHERDRVGERLEKRTPGISIRRGVVRLVDQGEELAIWIV
jgi:hypothetical protein